MKKVGNDMSWKIITDSSSNLRTIESDKIKFEVVPFLLQVGKREFIDNEQLDVSEMMEYMYNSEDNSVSSCPSPNSFLEASDGFENVIGITISSSLSGSHNSARIAMDELKLKNTNANYYLIDGLTAGAEIDLIILKLKELIEQNLTFEEVVSEIKNYQKKTKTTFVLSKVDNLVKNGRLNKIIGKVIGLLNIRMVGEATSDGKATLLQKSRGQKKSISALISEIKAAGYHGGSLIISHTNNIDMANEIATKIKEFEKDANITIIENSGLCSFYSESDGIIVGYEIS